MVGMSYGIIIMGGNVRRSWVTKALLRHGGACPSTQPEYDHRSLPDVLNTARSN